MLQINKARWKYELQQSNIILRLSCERNVYNRRHFSPFLLRHLPFSYSSNLFYSYHQNFYQQVRSLQYVLLISNGSFCRRAPSAAAFFCHTMVQNTGPFIIIFYALDDGQSHVRLYPLYVLFFSSSRHPCFTG